MRHPRKASVSSESQPSSSEVETQLFDFSQIPKILRARFQCMTSFTSPGHISHLGFLFWHLWMTSSRRAGEHQTNPCAKRKVLSLTKPNGKIYKTKSLGHFITAIIIIIMSRRLRGYPWPSLAISPYHSSPPAGLQDYNPCPHIAAVCKFVLVVPLLHIHEWGSTGVHRLWARPCFSSSVPRVWFVELV